MTAPIGSHNPNTSTLEVDAIDDPELGLSYSIEADSEESREATIARFRQEEGRRQADFHGKYLQLTSSASTRFVPAEMVEDGGRKQDLISDVLSVLTLGLFSATGCNPIPPPTKNPDSEHSELQAATGGLPVCSNPENTGLSTINPAEAKYICRIPNSPTLAEMEQQYYDCAVAAAQQGKVVLALTIFNSLQRNSDSSNHFLKYMAGEGFHKLADDADLGSGFASGPDSWCRNPDEYVNLEFNYRETWVHLKLEPSCEPYCLEPVRPELPPAPPPPPWDI